MSNKDTIELIKHWFSMADYDIKTAQSMFDAKRYPYALFMCHLSIEKLLKAIIVKQIKEHAPYTHNLIELGKNTQINFKEEQKILLADLKEFNLEAHKNLLNTHRSTKERLDIYEDLYRKLPEFNSILDLACGLNPFSLLFLKILNFKYYAYDLECQELNLIKEYFKTIKNNFSEFDFEVKEINLFEETPKIKTDLAFIFKFFDLLETRNQYKLAEKIISEINSNHIIVSFSTRTLSGKLMNHPNRKWFELMLERLDLKFKIFKYENEIFYFIEKY